VLIRSSPTGVLPGRSWYAFMLAHLSNLLTVFAETSSHTLTFAFALLAMHPEIQERLFEETKALWPETEGENVCVLWKQFFEATPDGLNSVAVVHLG
jgi:hypothetical protein